MSGISVSFYNRFIWFKLLPLNAMERENLEFFPLHQIVSAVIGPFLHDSQVMNMIKDMEKIKKWAEVYFWNFFC